MPPEGHTQGRQPAFRMESCADAHARARGQGGDHRADIQTGRPHPPPSRCEAQDSRRRALDKESLRQLRGNPKRPDFVTEGDSLGGIFRPGAIDKKDYGAFRPRPGGSACLARPDSAGSGTATAR